MFKDMSKLEKAGLVIGAIECVAGFGFAIYAHCKCKKAMLDSNEAVDKIIEESNEILDELLEETQIVTEENKNEFLEIMKRTQELMKEQGTN